MIPNTRQRLALSHLRRGVIAHPTDTVYGLACAANNPSAITTLIKIKKRSASKGFILLASDIGQVLSYIKPSFASALKNSVKKAGNQATTFLVPASVNTPATLTGGSLLIAVRITNNALVRFFCESLSSALVSTSANIQGQKTATSLLQLKMQFKDKLSFTLPPDELNNQASAIINLVSGERVR